MRSLLTRFIRALLSLVLMSSLFFGGCGTPMPPDPNQPISLPYSGEGFALFSLPKPGLPLRDLYVLDHGSGDLSSFIQDEPRHYLAGTPQHLGFHPGVIRPWTQEGSPLVFAAEGDGAVRGLTPESPFQVLSGMEEDSPRFWSRFDWPGWGPSLAVSPYRNGYLILYKGYDPLQGTAARVVVPLAESPMTLRSAERVAVADIDGDGIQELLFVISVTGEIMRVKAPVTEGGVPERATVIYQDTEAGMPNEVHPVDLDEDGDLDLVLPDEVKPGKIRLLQNDGQGHFTEAAALDFPGGEGVMELRIATDRDGRRYFLGVGVGHVALLRQPPIDPFRESWEVQDLLWQSKNLTLDMLFEDLDGDGWLDAVLTKLSGDHNLWVLHGPLWERFESLRKAQYQLP